MELPEGNVVVEGEVIGGVPVQAVGQHVEGHSVDHLVDGGNHLELYAQFIGKMVFINYNISFLFTYIFISIHPTALISFHPFVTVDVVHTCMYYVLSKYQAFHKTIGQKISQP